MTLKLKLIKKGTKQKPIFYFISKKKKNNNKIHNFGNYNPLTNPKLITLNNYNLKKALFFGLTVNKTFKKKIFLN